jgi:murein L,D-transpeptidase YcbB/YkuD
MRYANHHWFPEEEYPRRQPRNPVLRARLQKDIDAARGDKISVFVEGLAPRFSQYDRLRTALSRYRKLDQDGGWKKVSRIRGARKGKKHKNVPGLKARLAAEGYHELISEPTNVFDQALEDAVKRYQSTHQLKVNGEPNRLFWSSINTPLRDRIRQIEINLARWRDTRIAHDKYYLHVNLPDFHGEVWRDDNLQLRFRVVVGSRKIFCDRRKKKKLRVNATPLFSDEIELVVYNPYWNVPERIFKEEIVPKMVASATYLEDEGYECVSKDPETELCKRVRQKSGEGNALGQVKIVFPNGHGVYMHDTPRKKLFNLPIRAFSHGCMRVQEPLKLAETILTNDGQFDQKVVDKTLAHGKEHGIRLKEKVPVHIEYYTVRVDDEENVHFLADIYRYDREAITGESTVGGACDPEPLVELSPESQPASEAESQPASEAASQPESDAPAAGETPAPAAPDKDKDKDPAPPIERLTPAAPADPVPATEGIGP